MQHRSVEDLGWSSSRHLLLAVLGWLIVSGSPTQVLADEQLFERQIRPLLIERCHRCHAGDTAKGGLRLDSRAAALKGGETGPALVPDHPDQSLLLQAVRHSSGLKMPPDGRLAAAQVEALTRWIQDGASWPESTTPVTAEFPVADKPPLPRRPDDPEFTPHLQFWVRADSLEFQDGDSVAVWPDQSGHGRDLSATRGIREGGVGVPASFIRHSSLRGRPGVRFTPSTGLATSPGHPVDIRGDAALTISIVFNLTRFDGQPSHASVFGVGNPAAPGDPGRPLAALVEIDQPQKFSLDFAGGWGHDAILNPGSFEPLFDKTVIATFVKHPGPIKDTTRFYLNGQLAGPRPDQPVTGRDGIPDIQHRADVGLFLGKALTWCGAIQGDIGEVILLNTALSDANRLSLELYLGDKFGLWIDEERTVVPRAKYTAEEKSHWAYQPLLDVTLPPVRDEAWIKTPVDRFTLADFESNHLSPPPPIDKRTLLRRVTFDLTGLPPTPGEVAEFLADDSPRAYETVVDRLLQSPHYGERWGRHWLDLVRYAESTANDANAVMPHAWRYRNYVIDAFNTDLPYDQFLIEQLAGDLLPPTETVAVNTRRVIATGYLMIGPKALAETDKEQSRLDIVDDQIDVTGRAMLGLTLACARCHDHKFDAVRASDYYALAGIFRSTEPFQNEVRNASMWWEFPVSQGPGLEPLMVMAPKETQPRNLRIHLRGNRFALGKVVPRGSLGILAAVAADRGDQPPSIDPHQPGSGRLDLARWIASPANPLTPRVLVNRIWQLHFGRGIVATPDNFGTRGQKPSDPRLLDWLTRQFLGEGWSIKHLQRLIVLSHTYQLPNAETTAKITPTALPESLVARQVRRRRLSAEELRDALLMVAGQLDTVPGRAESGDFLLSKSENINAQIRPNRVGADDEFYQTFRKRSVYLPIVRNMLPDVLALFDAADPNGVTAIRSETTVASQGLFLLNHPFVLEQSRALAERVLAAPLPSEADRVQQAHVLTYGRPASPDETAETLNFLRDFAAASALQHMPEPDRRRAAWQSLCQSLLCGNEFLYVE